MFLGKVNHVSIAALQTLKWISTFLLAIAVIWPTIEGRASTGAAKLPPACVQPDEGNMSADGLPRNDPSVVQRYTHFEFNENQYEVETFSATAPSPISHSLYCLRYEVENTSGKKIVKFYWPLIGLRLSEFESGAESRRSRKFTKPSAREPIVDKTELFAFYNSEADSEVHQIREEMSSIATTPARAKGETDVRNISAVPTVVDLKKTFPDIAKAYVVRDLSMPTVFGHAPARIAQDYVEISDSYAGQGFKVISRSNARYNGKTYIVSTRLTVMDRAGNRLKVSAPYLMALERSKDAEDLLRWIPQMTKENLPLEKSQYVTGREQWRVYDKEVPTLFLIQHPITILIGGRRECFLASSYSPFPTSFGLDLCNMDWKLQTDK